MIKALTGLKPEWWTPPSEEDKDNPSQFYLRPLDGFQNAEIMAEARMDAVRGFELTAKGLRLCLTYGLIGWKNLADPEEEGKELEFKSNNKSRLPTEWMIAVCAEIVRRSQSDEAQKKTS